DWWCLLICFIIFNEVIFLLIWCAAHEHEEYAHEINDPFFHNYCSFITMSFIICCSFHTLTPNFSALSYVDPASSPATTISVFLLTLPVTDPPIASIFSFASLRVKCSIFPVNTIVLPVKTVSCSACFGPV